MTVLLLDASVWLASDDPKDRYHASASALVSRGPAERALAALDLTLFEVANVAICSWRSPERAYGLVELVEVAVADNLERVVGETVCATVSDAYEHGLSSYDAAYVTVARRRGWTLVSCDHRDLVEAGHAVTPDEVVAEGRRVGATTLGSG